VKKRAAVSICTMLALLSFALFAILLAPARQVVAKADVTATCARGTLAPGKRALTGDENTCAGGTLTPNTPSDTVDLLVSTPCNVPGGPGGPGNAMHYYFKNVYIFSGGSLNFADAQVDFWASNILVDNGGRLSAGSQFEPIGLNGRGSGCANQVGGSCAEFSNSEVLTIHLYGAPSDPDISCQTGATCGVDPKIWTSNGACKFGTGTCEPTLSLPGGVKDYFYGYDYMAPDMAPHDKGFFGHKVLAVSYNGQLELFGAKGAPSATSVLGPLDSGTSWRRLTKTVNKGDTVLQLDRPVDWQAGDLIVLTTTDYLASHSEQLEVKTGATKANPMVSQVTVTDAVNWTHNGDYYPLSKIDPKDRLNLAITITDGKTRGIETRAAVGLLSRSIKIVSGGDTVGTDLPPATSTDPDRYFGGHTIVRQGFALFHMQGIEFFQLGQGGSIGHYPVHFHLARITSPANNPDRSAGRQTFVNDCSIRDSMTRFITLHATQDVTLARNVGEDSIGHGFYLEDGSEIDNKLYSNLGVMARAAVSNKQNPRNVPGILAQNTLVGDNFPFNSDWAQPTVFWIMNGWNDFQGNMAAGAGTCGACYWFVPGQNSGFSSGMKWDGYAAIQAGRGLTSPMYQFYKNSCTSASNSFNTINSTFTCNGVGTNVAPDLHLNPIPNPAASAAPPSYFPNIPGGGRLATRCPAGMDCANTVKVPTCSQEDKPYGTGQKGNCMVTVLDQYTTSFNYSETNLAAVWLRPQWYLFLNSAITDVLNGGLTFVTGGGFTRSDAIAGYWSLATKSVFVGNTQDNNPYAANDGPFNPGGLKCATNMPAYQNRPGNYCLSIDDGMVMQLSNFGVNQRLFNIYDGPSYEESNAYANITPTYLTGCNSTVPAGVCIYDWMVGGQAGIPRDPSQPGSGNSQCYLPNAAIAWKQPNGFYYPPAFHSDNLLFTNVPIRHFVIEPLLLPGTYLTDLTGTKGTNAVYCSSPGNASYFQGYTDIDRQTELNDDDGTLTGLVNTISVNEDPFFSAPTETAECRSNVGIGPNMNVKNGPPPTARTSPYDYVTTVLYPSCAQTKPTSCGDNTSNPLDPNYGHGGNWSRACAGPYCFGVPLYRQYLNPDEQTTPFIRMAGQSSYQRSTLTLNNANYYVDTTITRDRQVDQTPVAAKKYTFDPVTNLIQLANGNIYPSTLVVSNPATNEPYELNLDYVANTIQGILTRIPGPPMRPSKIPVGGMVNVAYTYGTTLPFAPNTERSFNVFQKNNTYYLFLVYGKNTTKQTYQLYVGSGFNKNTDLLGTRVDITGEPFQTYNQPLASAPWLKNANVTGGLLTVTIDLSAYTTELNPANPDGDLCKPTSFCNWDTKTKTCGCNASADDYPLLTTDPGFKAECGAVCNTWAVKDLDCPAVEKTATGDYVSGGCFGLAIKLGDSFSIPPQTPPQPTTACFPESVFDTEFMSPNPTTLAGDCEYKPPLPEGEFGKMCP
jgi:hypothetical protein